MLSRISLISQKTNNTYTLLKLTTQSSLKRQQNNRLLNSFGVRGFTTTNSEANNESVANSTPKEETQEKVVEQATIQDVSEKCFLTLNVKFDIEESEVVEGGARERQRGTYQQRPPRYPVPVLSQVDEMLPTYESFVQTKSYQLQQQIYNLIKTKIGTTDNEKIQHFYSQLSQRNVDGSALLEDMTLQKIRALIKEKKEIDEKEAFEKSIKEQSETYLGDKVQYSKYEMQPPEYFAARDEDTLKSKPMTQDEYETYLIEQYNQLQAKMVLEKDILRQNKEALELDIVEEISGIDDSNIFGKATEKQQTEESILYNNMLREMKTENLRKVEGLPKSQFDIERVTQDLVDFNERIRIEKDFREIDQGKAYEMNPIDQVNLAFVENQLRNEQEEQDDVVEFEELWQGMNYDFFSNMKEELKSYYDQAHTLKKLNQNLRVKLVSSVRLARSMLFSVLKHKTNLVSRLESQSREMGSDILPKKLFDFIAKERSISQRRKDLIKQYQERNFDHMSRDIEAYNKELILLLNHYSITSEKNQKQKFVDRLQHVINLIHQNKVEINVTTKAKVFEFAVVSSNNELANQMLKQVASAEHDYPYSLIDPESLNSFFSRSIRTDNFKGLGHLITYVEKYGVDISSWDLKAFSSALNFYLNAKFDLNNVLIFTKYYTYFHGCRLRNSLQEVNKPLDQLTEQEKFALNAKVFDSQSSVVDMRSLFGFLVDKVGSQHALDPVTKVDQLWKIVEFFTKSGIQEIAGFSKTNYNSLNESDVAKYFRNHFNDSKTFEKITQVLLRTNDKQTLHNIVIQNLKEYQAQNKSLPFSFQTPSVRNAYNRIRGLNNKNNFKLNEKTAEYFLFVFKSLQMWPEIIDLCENFEKLTRNAIGGGNNEIRNYYLSDTLLQLPSKQHYYELIPSAVYGNHVEQHKTSPGYITAMTKAYFKDGTKEHAVKFFDSSVKELRNLKQKREDFLVSLFDSAYGEEQKKDITYEDFKEKYLDVIELSNRCVQESYAVSQLRSIINKKDYDDIETLFQLYLVQKEENALLVKTGLQNTQSSSSAVSTVLETSSLSDSDHELLDQLRLRKHALQSKLNHKDIEAINNLQNVLKNKKVNLLDSLAETSADDIQKMFNVMSKEQIEEVLERGDRFRAAANSLRDEHSQTLYDVAEKRIKAIEEALKENMQDVFYPRDVPSKFIEKSIDAVYRRRRVSQREIQKHAPDLNEFHQHMLTNELDEDEIDPMNIAADAHDATLIDLREQLLEAVNARKSSKVLPLTLQIFNKLQDQSLKAFKLNTVEQLDENSDQIDAKVISDAIQKFELLYNNPRSPVFSALQNLALYQGDRGMQSLYSMVKDFTDVDHENPFDLINLQKEQQQLERITEEVSKSIGVMKNIQKYILKQQQDLNNESIDYKDWSKKNDEYLAQAIEARIQKLYVEYKDKLSQDKKSREFSREDKLEIMRDVLALEYGQRFTSNDAIFPAFYCQDLIVFGLENNIAESVRLGEKMMSENGYILSRDMQMAVKNYLLENGEEYQQAMKTTGPIDNTTLYRNVQRKREQQDDDYVTSIFNVDDPYWKDFLNRNSKRQYQWRVPSHLAWNHKTYGILGEVIDVKHMEQTLKTIRNFY